MEEETQKSAPRGHLRCGHNQVLPAGEKDSANQDAAVRLPYGSRGLAQKDGPPGTVTAVRATVPVPNLLPLVRHGEGVAGAVRSGSLCRGRG